MLFFVCGVPGRFTRWCDALAAALVGRALGPSELLRAETLEALAMRTLADGAAHGIVAARQPGGGLRTALRDSGRNFVFVLDDLRPALLDLVLGDGLSLPAAIQAMASSCGALMDVQGTPAALALHRGAAGEREIADAIARHFGLEIAADAVAAILREIGPAAAADPSRDPAQWWDGLEPAARETVLGALGAYHHYGEGDLPAIAWTGALFFAGDRPGERLAGPVDITGRARCLLEGPHIALPSGAWSLSLHLLLSRGATEHEFAVEVHADNLLAAGTIRSQGADRAELALDFALDPAAERPVAIRISSLRAAFDGAIALDRAVLARAPAATSSTM